MLEIRNKSRNCRKCSARRYLWREKRFTFQVKDPSSEWKSEKTSVLSCKEVGANKGDAYDKIETKAVQELKYLCTIQLIE